MSPAVQSVSVAVRRLGFSSDEILGENIIHPASFSLGCAWGVSSPFNS
jgi:hypothetical protein